MRLSDVYRVEPTGRSGPSTLPLEINGIQTNAFSSVTLLLMLSGSGCWPEQRLARNPSRPWGGRLRCNCSIPTVGVIALVFSCNRESRASLLMMRSKTMQCNNVVKVQSYADHEVLGSIG